MKICFAGDCNFISEVYDVLPEEIIVDKELWEADQKYINLEQVISQNKITTNKYMIHSGNECYEYLKALDITGVSLANNHIHDKGSEGIGDTVDFLDQIYIKHAGAGKNLEEAMKAFEIEKNLCFLAFCDYGKPYIRDVQCATSEEAGINPYSLENVLKQLDMLPEKCCAIIYIHWSIEYSWLVPFEYIEAAKKILSHPKAKLLIGQHPHIPLGWIEIKGKYAFFSLGNFLFPNFYLCPPNKVIGSQHDLDKTKYPCTRIMCSVKQKTYKKWYFINRVSIIVRYNTENQKIKLEYSYQKDNEPYIYKLRGTKKKLVNIWLNVISLIYKFPKPIYLIMYKTNLLMLYGIRKIKRGMVNYIYDKKYADKQKN